MLHSPRWAGKGLSLTAVRPDSAGFLGCGACGPSLWSSLHAHDPWPAASPSWWCLSVPPPACWPGPAGLSPAAPPGHRPASENPGTNEDRILDCWQISDWDTIKPHDLWFWYEQLYESLDFLCTDKYVYSLPWWNRCSHALWGFALHLSVFPLLL